MKDLNFCGDLKQNGWNVPYKEHNSSSSEEKSRHLTVRDLEDAENSMLCFVQHQAFAHEIDSLS